MTYPEHFAALTPYTAVKDAPELMRFVKEAFSATEMKCHLRPDGSIQHAQVLIGNSILMLSDANDQWPAMPVNVYLYIPNNDAVYQKALDCGATSLMPPSDQDYGDRMSGVRDRCGNNWWIATPIQKT